MFKYKKPYIIIFYTIIYLSFVFTVYAVENTPKNSYKPKKQVKILNEKFTPSIPLNKSQKIKDVLPEISDSEIDNSPTITEKISFRKYSRDIWVTLSCQSIVILFVIYIIYLIICNRKIPIGYEPHIRSKYHSKRKFIIFKKRS